MSPTAGTRPNVAINSNRWAGRTLSQQVRRKNWTPPDLPECPHDVDRISHYSRRDYIIGEKSQDVLRSIANRLINGPSPVGALPELDSSELETEMAELSRQKKSETNELWGDYEAVELNATPIARVPPDERTNCESVGNGVLDRTPTSYRSGPFSELDQKIRYA